MSIFLLFEYSEILYFSRILPDILSFWTFASLQKPWQKVDTTILKKEELSSDLSYLQMTGSSGVLCTVQFPASGSLPNIIGQGQCRIKSPVGDGSTVSVSV